MKIVLKGTTALALALVASAAGGAQAAEKITLSVGGYMHVYAVAGDQSDGVGEPAAGLRDHMMTRESEIHFKGETLLDNGLKAGVNVQLEGETCGDQIDESFLYLQGSFGKIIIGADDSAPSQMEFGSDAPIPGHGLNSPTFRHPSVGANAISVPFTDVSISSDSEKIIYFTPRFAGLQLGASYSPEPCEYANAGTSCAGGAYSGFHPTGNAGQQSEIVEIGANYAGKFSGVEVGISAGYGEADLEAPAAGATADAKQWAVGLRLSVAGVTAGLGYHWSNQGLAGSNGDRTDIVAGISCRTGPWKVALQYANVEAEAGPGLGADELDAVEVGARYTLGPGVTLAGGLQWWDLRDNLGAPGLRTRP